MSKFLEYVNMIKEGLPNTSQVLEGLINNIKEEFGTLSEEEQAEILRRRLICKSCPLSSQNLFKDDTAYRKLYNKPFQSERKDEDFCGICSCPLKTRTSSLSSDCGLSVYNKKHPENIQPLKWEKFK